MPKHIVVSEENQKIVEEVIEIPLSDRLRSKRNELLKECDHIALYDNWISMSEEDQNSWLVYRQLLREIPQQERFPEDVSWPTKPTASKVEISDEVIGEE